MRRTSARRPLMPLSCEMEVDLRALPCRQCCNFGATVIAMGRDERGAVEWTWCSIACAQLDGWPSFEGRTWDGLPVAAEPGAQS